MIYHHLSAVMDNQVIITYKRKRFSSAPKSSPKPPTGISFTLRKSSPNVEFGDNNEKQKNKDLSCVKCGNIDVDKNLLCCECCFKTYHFHCINTPQKPIAQGKWLCSTCHRRNEHEESLQHYVRDSKRGRKRKRINELEIGPMDDIKQNHVSLNSSSETKSRSGCHEDSIMVSQNSDKNDNCLKERKTPLITFQRRSKKKQVEREKCAEWNSKPENSSTAAIGLAVEESCMYEGSSQICSSKDQSTSATVLQEQAGMTNVENDAGLVSTLDRGLGETKITGDGCEELPSHNLQETRISNQNPTPSQPATNLPGSEDQSDTLMAAPAIDLNKNSILNEDSNQQNSDKFSTLGVINVSKERGHPCELESSVAPTSKPSIDLKAENLLESQSSSTPSCPTLLLDEETDGRGKELEWLEDLDRVLQDKKNINTPSFMQHGGDDCGQASSRMASSTVPTKSSIQSTSDQGAPPEYMHQMTSLRAEIFSSNLSHPAYRNRQHKETSNRSSRCTNFLGVPECEKLHPEETVNRSSLCTNILGLSQTLNPKAPSISGIKDNIHTPTRHSLWHASDETSFLSRHKKIVENDNTGTRLLFRERQSLMVDMFRRSSNEWSEEELDSLWIGVRRHGVNNWDAVLRDPKLQSLESRTAEELSLRWDVEQRKLLTGTLMQPLRLSKSDYSSSSSSRVMDDILLARPVGTTSKFSMFTSDTKLSLGDVYCQRQNLFYSSGESLHPKTDISHQMPVRAQNTRCGWGPSILQQTDEKFINCGHESAGPSASNNLPHWLKEILSNTGTNTRGSSLPIGVLNGEPLAPPKGSRRRGILKRKRIGYGNKNVGLRINEAQSSQKIILDNLTLEKSCTCNPNNNVLVPIGPSDLVVIDSDVSSEETISDDQNSRLS